MQHLMANTEFMSWPTVQTLSRVRLRCIMLRRNFIERRHFPHAGPYPSLMTKSHNPDNLA
jgi:hypothetical protein